MKGLNGSELWSLSDQEDVGISNGLRNSGDGVRSGWKNDLHFALENYMAEWKSW